MIADLDGDGSPEVITAAGTRIYVWEADGKLRDRLPGRATNRAVLRPALSERRAGGAWHRKCGFLATPAVGRVEGADKPLDIVAPSLDGHLYAFDRNGTAAPRLPGRPGRPGAGAPTSS